MSKYMIFEAGSRCGFSAEYFFKKYRKEFGTKDELIEVDINPYFIELGGDPTNGIKRVSQNEAEKMITNDDSIVVFPADELTRQSNALVRERANRCSFSKVYSFMYDKKIMNEKLNSNALLYVPKTFSSTDVFLRPNTMSAGSKNVGRNEFCVTEYIDIVKEYVVDVDYCNDVLDIYPREVALQHGYDKYIRFINPKSKEFEELHSAVVSFLLDLGVCEYKIFHLQLAKDSKGRMCYIESSKRLSGTSVVNALFGFNPFAAINNRYIEESVRAEYDKWYRYEDLLKML